MNGVVGAAAARIVGKHSMPSITVRGYCVLHGVCSERVEGGGTGGTGGGGRIYGGELIMGDVMVGG